MSGLRGVARAFHRSPFQISVPAGSTSMLFARCHPRQVLDRQLVFKKRVLFPWVPAPHGRLPCICTCDEIALFSTSKRMFKVRGYFRPAMQKRPDRRHPPWLCVTRHIDLMPSTFFRPKNISEWRAVGWKRVDEGHDV
jgi:hypothetical protein